MRAGIGFSGAGTAFESAAATTSAVPWPSTVPAGAFAALVGSVKATSGTATSTPSGWTQQFQQAIATNTILPSVYIAFKNTVTAGTEGGTTLTVSHTNNISAYQILVFTGVDMTTPLDVAVVVSDLNTASTATTFTSSTPVTPGVAGVMACGMNSTSANATPPSTQGGWTETGDRTGANTASFEFNYVLGIDAVATGTIANTWNQAIKNIGVIAWLRPAIYPTWVTPYQQVGASAFGGTFT